LLPYVELERQRNDFRGNDFREAELDYVAFVYGIDLRAQLLPEDPRYLVLDRLGERIEKVRAIVARWPDDKLRESAPFTLRVHGEGGHEEQELNLINRLSAPDEARAKRRPVSLREEPATSSRAGCIMEPVERTQISLTEEQARRLRGLARRKRTSMAALIRDAVDRVYPPPGGADERWARALDGVGGFHSGRADVSAEHDRELGDAFGR
jgi:hypothetical protein